MDEKSGIMIHRFPEHYAVIRYQGIEVKVVKKFPRGSRGLEKAINYACTLKTDFGITAFVVYKQ